jgi:hypothetical protein
MLAKRRRWLKELAKRPPVPMWPEDYKAILNNILGLSEGGIFCCSSAAQLPPVNSEN